MNGPKVGYVSPPVGNQVTRVFFGIPDRFFDLDTMRDLVLKALAAEKFTICGQTSHPFPPRGFTLLVLLAESHLAIHTTVEFGTVYVELYSCRGVDDGMKTMEIIGQALEAQGLLLDTRIQVPVKQANAGDD